MRKPTIHLNGTSAASLAEGYYTALTAVQDAIDQVRAVQPHGRDYYPQDYEESMPPQTVWFEANQEHMQLVDKLRSVEQSLTQLWQHCAKQVR